jgi:hypothetical protein
MAGPVALPPPVGGTVISSSAFGQPVAANIAALFGRPMFRGRVSTTQGVASGGNVALAFDAAEDYDTVNGHSTLTNNSRYTAQVGWSGYYRFKGLWFTAAAATGARYAWISVNGTEITGTQTGASSTPSSGNLSLDAEVEWPMNELDYAEVFVFQNSGGGLSTVSVPGSISCIFEAEWLRPL